jgi:hypothetical protein
MLGLTLEEAADGQATEVWECNWQSVTTFEAMSTQWRIAPDGPTGLDYAALPVVAQLLEVPRRRWADVFADVRVMEDAALKYFAHLRKQREKPHG